jgi:hypothetical protein
MYVVRNVFRAKPGQAVHLVAMFQRFTAALPPDLGLGPSRILTDASAGFWTVVVEDEVADLAAYLHTVERMGRLEAAKHLEGLPRARRERVSGDLAGGRAHPAPERLSPRAVQRAAARSPLPVR